MIIAMWIIEFVMVLLIIGMVRDIIKEIKNQFCPNGVVTGRDFESKHPASHPACRVLDFPGSKFGSKFGSKLISENDLLLKSNFTRPSGRTHHKTQSQN